MKAAGAWATMVALFARDLRLAQRRKSDTLGAAFFFVIVTSLFPLGVGPEPALLARMGPGIVWVAALLASMLSMPRLFAEDAADGCLFSINLIPHTLQQTTLGTLAPGMRVNLEVDLIARYVERMLGSAPAPG